MLPETTKRYLRTGKLATTGTIISPSSVLWQAGTWKVNINFAMSHNCEPRAGYLYAATVAVQEHIYSGIHPCESIKTPNQTSQGCWQSAFAMLDLVEVSALGAVFPICCLICNCVFAERAPEHSWVRNNFNIRCN